jgi:hypothetical protein
MGPGPTNTANNSFARPHWNHQTNPPPSTDALLPPRLVYAFFAPFTIYPSHCLTIVQYLCSAASLYRTDPACLFQPKIVPSSKTPEGPARRQTPPHATKFPPSRQTPLSANSCARLSLRPSCSRALDPVVLAVRRLKLAARSPPAPDSASSRCRSTTLDVKNRTPGQDPKKMPGMDIDMTRRNKAPRPLSDSERARLEEFIDSIHYSAR